MTKISPIAEYLNINKAISKPNKNGCDFYSPEGLYLGRLTKYIVDNYKVINIETFGDSFKKMYTKSIAIGQQFIYIKNNNAPIGINLVPIKTYMRKIFVNFIENTSRLEDSEKTFSNKLDLIAVDEETGVGLYETETPFTYNTKINNHKFEKLKQKIFKYTVN